MDKPYNDFEREYMAKTSGIKSDEAPIKNINELTQSDLIGRLAYLEKELQATPEHTHCFRIHQWSAMSWVG